MSSKIRQKYVKEEEESKDNCLYDKKIDLAVEGLTPFFDRILRRISRENGLIIAEYIAAMKREINISPGYKKANIQTLVVPF